VTEQQKHTVFSGVQPTGNIHLGNYLGAFRNWVALQDDPNIDAIYCIVDLHGMTNPYDPKDFETARLETAKVLLAIGIDPDRSLFYMQSQVPHHPELAWILGTVTPMGVLNRMTQFKDKTDRGVPASLGLFSYPVLMAADILLLRADLVPVGDDQKQHIEMTRDLAERFNNRFGEVFPVPDSLIPETSARVMSLTAESIPEARSGRSNVKASISQVRSTSSGSRVRREGTMAMSSKPQARLPDFAMPISISIEPHLQVTPARVRVVDQPAAPT